MVAPASATQRAARKVLSTCRRAPASAPFLFFVAPAFEFVWLAVFVGAGACKAESGKLGGVIEGGEQAARANVQKKRVCWSEWMLWWRRGCSRWSTMWCTKTSPEPGAAAAWRARLGRTSSCHRRPSAIGRFPNVSG